MKKLLLTAAATLACVAAFAQGKIAFNNDSLHLAFYDPAGGNPFAGQAIYAGGSNYPTTYSLMADLYVGTSSSTLSLATSTTWSGIAPGKWNLVNYQVPGVAGGGVVFVIAQIRGSGDTPAPTLTPLDAGSSTSSAHYLAWLGHQTESWATTAEFSFTLGSSPISYPNMYSSNGNWPQGTFALGGGNLGAVNVYATIPEPTSFALAGLGAAALLIFRRRK